MKNSKIVTILFLLFIVLWSGGGFTYGLFQYWPLFLLPVSIIVFNIRKLSLQSREITLLVIMVAFLLLQQFVYNGGLTNVIAATFSFISLFLISRIVSSDFSNLFVKIIVFFACASMLFWLVDISPSGHAFLLKTSYSVNQYGMDTIKEIRELHNFEYSRNLFFYSVNVDATDLIPRNKGPFYEPGRFTIYLTIALAINLFYHSRPVLSKNSIILLITNLTTFSTTGYVAMAILFAGYILNRYKVSFKSVFFSIVLVFVSIYISQLDFMAEKIVGQMQSESEMSRFGAALYHIPMIMNSPIIGYADRLSSVYGFIEMSPNGWTDLLLHWGIPVSLFWLFMLFKGTSVYTGDKVISRVCMFLVILTLAFTQTIMSSPFYMVLYFMGLDSTKK